ncbi:MAG: serine/threonine-protein kinase [Myxococcales bacterium]|nr:serine/threonine-protein kinase [Myxococcales bacterium]
MNAQSNTRLKARSTLGKYRIARRIGEGGFATVYRARDTIEGIDVALKLPNAELVGPGALEELRREVKLTAQLEHPNILPIKNAVVIDGRFVMAYPLGQGTLADRITRRVSARKALFFAEQMIDAVACAHAHRIIHCDIKPDNFILFADDRLRLGDFGVAKVALRRMTLGSVAGTIGYMAPEQAMGKPSYRSDVFSLGLLLYRLFAGVLPEWPFDWPPPGIERARQHLHADVIDLLRRCIELDERQRFADACALQTSFKRLRSRALQPGRRRSRVGTPAPTRAPAWRSLRTREFKRRFGSALEARAACRKCGGPVSESMRFCPWCSRAITKYDGPARFPGRCKRCQRSTKLDWRYCAYCHGAAIQEPSTRRYDDRRYSSRCGRCRGKMMPFMQYCPHCRSKAQQKWRIEGNRDSCKRCGWGVVREFWDYCPFCQRRIDARR